MRSIVAAHALANTLEHLSTPGYQSATSDTFTKQFLQYLENVGASTIPSQLVVVTHHTITVVPRS